MKKIISSYVIFSMVLGTVGFFPITALATNNNENQGGGNDKINICHKTASEANPWVVQSIGADLLPSHNEHGDYQYNGPMDGDKPDNTDKMADQWCEDNAGETPVVDVCPNIEGDQAVLPEGYQMVEGDCVPVPPPVTTATLVATKIVCDSETDLPNFGNGVNITSSTATDFLLANPNCHLASGWDFEFAPDGTPNPGSSMIGSAGSPWTTFGQTLIDGKTSTMIPAGALVWVREVMKSGFVGYSDDIGEPLPENPVSAEFYCTTDGVNYDNYDWIDSVIAGDTYYCVAFNAPIADTDDNTSGETDVCLNISEVQLTVPEGMVLNDGQCVTPENEDENDEETTNPTDVCLNIDGVQTEVPNGKVLNAGNCVDASVTTETPACSSNCGNENTGGNGGGGNGGGGSGAPAPAANGPIVGSFAGATGGTIGGGQVLGESCGIYLNDYLRIGENNNVDEVKKLQTFLNEYMGLNLDISGFFDIATFEAVSKFQAKESDEVLQPWVRLGLLKEGETTGYVFKTTKRWINMIKCAELNIPVPNLLSN